MTRAVTSATAGAAGATRADVALVSRGVVRSRALAQRLIESGAVDLMVSGSPVAILRCAQPVYPEQELRVRPSPEARFASRGGAKLEHALTSTGIDCRGATVLDVGMSTGGFADCLLHHGACRVVGIEVGHGQLHERLASDSRIVCFEKTHVRDLTRGWFVERGIEPAAFRLIVVDLSFISTLSLLGRLAGFAAADTTLIALIKPQFELGPHSRNPRGIVKPGADLQALRERAWSVARQADWQLTDWFACDLRGTDGNQEYFLVARRAAARLAARQSTLIRPHIPDILTGPVILTGPDIPDNATDPDVPDVPEIPGHSRHPGHS